MVRIVLASPFSAEESIGSSPESIIPSGVERPDCVLEGPVREDTAADALLAGPLLRTRRGGGNEASV